MSAWIHRNNWSTDYYAGYRRYVGWQAPLLKGRQEDCADLSLMLIVDFAEAEGLPLTFKDNKGVRYISKASEQKPSAAVFEKKWTTKAEYLKAVQDRIGADALFRLNTDVNCHGPEPGDLMLTSGHAALVFAVYPPSVEHPKAGDPRIPVFPGPEAAAKQLNQTEYFRTIMSGAPRAVRHIDYLNHRGEGAPVKQKAELIYYADEDLMRGQGFQYKEYSKMVLDNWIGWDGSGDPPH